MFQILNKLSYITHLPFEMNVNNQKVTKKRTTLYFIKKDEKIVTTELSPFPGFSDDTLESLEFKLENALKGQYLPNQNPHIDFSLFELDLKLSWNKSFTPQDIKSNKLINYKHPVNFNELTKYQTIKIKIDNDTHALKLYFEKYKDQLSKFKLRIDANARLTLSELETIYKIIKENKLDLDYFEEPLQIIKDYKTCQVPFALDENIRFYKAIKNAHTLILKPTQFFTKNLWEDTTHQRPIVISSTFDSLFTHATLTAMALQHKEVVHGLDNSNYNDLGFGLGLKDVFPTVSEKHYKNIINKS